MSGFEFRWVTPTWRLDVAECIHIWCIFVSWTRWIQKKSWQSEDLWLGLESNELLHCTPLTTKPFPSTSILFLVEAGLVCWARFARKKKKHKPDGWLGLESNERGLRKYMQIDNFLLRADADHSAPSLGKLWMRAGMWENEFELKLKLPLSWLVGFSQLTWILRLYLLLWVSWQPKEEKDVINESVWLGLESNELLRCT
jgi:hypothetical protein